VPDVPPIVQDVLRSPGHPLDEDALAAVESRFGHDFSRVRVHTDARAAESAQAVNARAYTVGRDVVFGAGQYTPGTPAGQRLLTHELTHVIQQPSPTAAPTVVAEPDSPQEREAAEAAGGLGQNCRVPLVARAVRAGAARLWRTPDDLTGRARYPTAAERESIQAILNPQQQAATAQGQAVPPVTDPVGFKADMTARLNPYIDQVLLRAKRVESAAVVLGVPELQSLATVAQQEVQTFYGAYLSAATHTPVEQARRAGYQLESHLHVVPSVQTPETDEAASQWVASRMRQQAPDLLEEFRVLGGPHERDEALFLEVRDHIFNDRTTDLRSIILFAPGYEAEGEAYIQPRLGGEFQGQDPHDTRRGGRWRTLGTLIHEMLHALAHEDFSDRVRGLEESGIAVEGFAEYLTRPVYANLAKRAGDEEALRTSIQGEPGPLTGPPERTGYPRYVAAVEKIRAILGGNEVNIKIAFFLGRIEYLGLGGWNEAEAVRQRSPANVLGAAALLTSRQEGLFRIDYGRVLLGRGGNLQLQLGGTINYLTEGQRLGLGPALTLQYSWPNVYLRAGLGVVGSASLGQPFTESVRLDLLPGAEVGVRLGIVRVGAGATLLIPVAGGPVSDRVVRVAGSLGLSLDL
jgi:hypothetical protein